MPLVTNSSRPDHRLPPRDSQPQRDSQMVQCPGDGMWITQAVHHGRQQAGYPACEHCEYCDQQHVGATRSRSIQLVETGIRGLAYGAFSLSVMERFGNAMAVFIDELARQDPQHKAGRFIVGHDGRASTPSMTMALLRGLQNFGAQVEMVGNCDRALLRHSLQQSQQNWSIWVTGEGQGPGATGLDILDARGAFLPFSQWEQILSFSRAAQLSRPERHSQVPVQSSYVESRHQSRMALYHALRPLKLVVRSDSPLATQALQLLSEELRWDLIWLQRSSDSSAMSQTIRQQKCDLGLHIEESGERLIGYNEAGQCIETQALCEGILRMLTSKYGEQSRLCVGAAANSGMQWQTVIDEQQLVQQLKGTRNAVGMGKQGRLWFVHQNHVECDALLTLGYVMQAMSQSSLPASYIFEQTTDATTDSESHLVA